MTNSANGAALIEEILTSIAAEYGWPEFAVVEKAAVAVDAAAYGKLAGNYRLLDQPAHVVAEGGRLYVQSPLFGARRMELFPESETIYFMTAEDMSIRFDVKDGGGASGFSLIRGAATYPGTRQQ
jgi:hypothetical protein